MRKSFLLVFGIFIATQSFAAPPYSRPTIGQYKPPTYTPPPPVRMPSTTPMVTVPHIETPKNFTNPQPQPAKNNYNYTPLPYQQIPYNTHYNNVEADGIKSDELRKFYHTCFLELPKIKFYNTAMATNSFNESIDEFVKENARKKKFTIPEWVEPKLAEIDKTYAKDITEEDDANIGLDTIQDYDPHIISFDNCIALISKNPDNYHLAKDARIQKIAKNIQIYDPLIEENILPKYNFNQLIKAGDFINKIEKQTIIAKAMNGTPTGEKYNKLMARYEIANSQAQGNYHPLDKNGKPEKFDCIIEDSLIIQKSLFDVERAYPLEALDKELSGFVDAVIKIDEHGNIINLDMLASGPEFGGERMERKIRELKYYPTIKNCMTSGGNTHLSIKFQLD